MAQKKLVPIKIRIKDGARYKYPDFNQLPVVQAWMADNPGFDWSNYCSVEGEGLMYDNVGNFSSDEADAPLGYWSALLLIPAQFATEAVAQFPADVKLLTSVEAEDFYNNKHSKDFPDEDIDEGVLGAIKMKQDLGLPLTADQQKALDPNDDTPGIRKNKNKLWSDMLIKKNIKIN